MNKTGYKTAYIEKSRVDEAKRLVQDCGLISHIGHAATAEVLTGLLGQSVAMDRKPWDGRGKALTGSRPTFPPCRFPWAGQRGGRCNAHRPSTRRACR